MYFYYYIAPNCIKNRIFKAEKEKNEKKRYNEQLKSQYVSQVFVIGYLQRIIFVFYRYRGSWHLAYQ